MAPGGATPAALDGALGSESTEGRDNTRACATQEEAVAACAFRAVVLLVVGSGSARRCAWWLAEWRTGDARRCSAATESRRTGGETGSEDLDYGV